MKKPSDLPAPAAAAILLATLMSGFIVYGSLYPFRFQPLPEGRALGDALSAALQLRRPGRGDLAANLLLYGPLGLALSLALATRLRASHAALLGFLGCVLLSACMEVGQLFVPRRTPSVWDLALNSLGAAVGAAAGAILSPRPEHAAYAWRPSVAEAFPAVLLGCWLAYRLYPYVPALDLGEWRASLSPLLPPWNPDPLRTLRLAIFWLVAARLLDAAWPTGARGVPVVIGVMLLTLVAAIPIVDRRLTQEEVIAVCIASPAWFLLHRRTWADRVLLPAMLLAIILEGARPYHFLAEPRAFGWIPLRSLMSGHWGNGLQAMLYKFFFYGGLVWLALRSGLRLPLAATITVALAIGISVLQTWLPGRSAETTDALIALGAVITVRLLMPPAAAVSAQHLAGPSR